MQMRRCGYLRALERRIDRDMQAMRSVLPESLTEPVFFRRLVEYIPKRLEVGSLLVLPCRVIELCDPCV
jgi:hypothetical protein